MSEQEGFVKGCNQEEAYVARQELERRKALNEQRKAVEAEQNRKAHWMCCPKCGNKMAETELDGVKLEQCGSCKGLFLDAGELDLIISRHDSYPLSKMFQSLFKMK